MKKYNSVQEFFKELPQTLLLVGNGKIEDKADLINSYECVIRFNDFEIDGYEHHVGTKVDAISFHCSDFTHPHSANLEKNYNKYLGKAQIFTTSPFLGNSKKDILHIEPNTKLLDVSQPIITNPTIRLSSGACLIINLSVLFLKNIHLIGFDFMSTGHYYDTNFSNEKFWKSLGNGIVEHDSQYEKSIITNLKNIQFIN